MKGWEGGWGRGRHTADPGNLPCGHQKLPSLHHRYKERMTFTVLQGRWVVRPCITYRVSESLSFGSQVSKQHLPHQSNYTAVHPPQPTHSLLPNLCVSPAFRGAAGVQPHWRALRRGLPLLGRRHKLVAKYDLLSFSEGLTQTPNC